MSNTSNKRTKKRLWTIAIVALVILLIVSFIISNKDKKIDPAAIENVQVSELLPHYKGNLESELTLVEYSDFQCPACKAAAPDIKNLVEQFGDKFKLEYRHFPLRSIHPNAQIGAQAAEAAGMQGKFWEMHDMLFDKQEEWSQSFNPERFFEEYATALGINSDRFMYDLESDQVKDLVNSQFKEAESLQLPGTPAFVVDGKAIDINAFVNEQLMGVLPAAEEEAETAQTVETETLAE